MDIGYTFDIIVDNGGSSTLPEIQGGTNSIFQCSLPTGQWVTRSTNFGMPGVSPKITNVEATAQEFTWESKHSLTWRKSDLNRKGASPLGQSALESDLPRLSLQDFHNQVGSNRSLFNPFAITDEGDLIGAVYKTKQTDLDNGHHMQANGTLYMIGDSTTLQWFQQLHQRISVYKLCSFPHAYGSAFAERAHRGFGDIKYVRYRIGGRPPVAERMAEVGNSAPEAQTSSDTAESVSTQFELALHTASRKEASKLARNAQSKTDVWLGSIANR